MPRILGLNLVGVLVASIVFFLIGWVWYGMLFQEAWMAAEGITMEAAESESPVWMASGFLITLLQVIGIGLILKWKGSAGLGGAVATAFALWFFLALPMCSYAYIYAAHNSTLLLIDAGHLLVGWVVSAIVLALIK
ncbi:DUF1761 domain-containing protein [Hyphococcus luteus]|nr:DUF1761 domain-containing protein [Marinicaulis flavus]